MGQMDGGGDDGYANFGGNQEESKVSAVANDWPTSRSINHAKSAKYAMQNFLEQEKKPALEKLNEILSNDQTTTLTDFTKACKSDANRGQTAR